MQLFGIKTCDTCRKALKAIEASGQEVKFHDVRATPLTDAQVQAFLDSFGDTLLNTRSTTWRGLSEAERMMNPVELLKMYPTLMKRPVIERAGVLTLGWGKDVQDKVLNHA
jgi:Spx/MgsR family transcriptional regulator